jgi:hypothetical protein
MHRICIYTMDELKAAEESNYLRGYDGGMSAGYNTGYEHGKAVANSDERAVGFKAGEKETWRAIASVGMLLAIVGIAILHFNSLI